MKLKIQKKKTVFKEKKIFNENDKVNYNKAQDEENNINNKIKERFDIYKYSNDKIIFIHFKIHKNIIFINWIFVLQRINELVSRIKLYIY